MRELPEEEQQLARQTKMLKRYAPSQAVVKRLAVVEESNVAMRAWLGVAKAPGIKGRRDPDRGKKAAAVTSGTKRKGAKRPGQGTLASWVVRTPKDDDGDGEVRGRGSSGC